jgi:hypothetical protein
MKPIDLADRTIRRAVFAVLGAAEHRRKCKGSDRLSIRGLARVLAWQFGLPPWTRQTDYSRLLQERHARSTVMFVGGYPIRRIQTRFGDVYAVIGSGSTFATLAQAEVHASKFAGGRADR